jgi:hypothetical protein
MVGIFVSNNTDPLTEMNQAFLIIPYIGGVYVAILTGISFTGWTVFKKKNNIQLSAGFAYSLIYSLIMFLGFIIFLIYFLSQ